MTKQEIITAAAKGVPLPDGLGQADTMLFLSLRALYSYAKHADMDKDQGTKEKALILKQYESAKLWEKIVEEHMRKEREFETAWNDFAQAPTWENADKLHEAWFKCGIKPTAEHEE